MFGSSIDSIFSFRTNKTKEARARKVERKERVKERGGTATTSSQISMRKKGRTIMLKKSNHPKRNSRKMKRRKNKGRLKNRKQLSMLVRHCSSKDATSK